jgi:hypothetical protein
MLHAVSAGMPFRPVSEEDFLRYSKALAFVIEEPIQVAQRILANVYGYDDVHELQMALKLPGVPGRFDSQFSYEEIETRSGMEWPVYRAHRIIAFVCSQKDTVNGSLHYRYHYAANLGLFEAPTVHREALRRVKAHFANHPREALRFGEPWFGLLGTEVESRTPQGSWSPPWPLVPRQNFSHDGYPRSQSLALSLTGVSRIGLRNVELLPWQTLRRDLSNMLHRIRQIAFVDSPETACAECLFDMDDWASVMNAVAQYEAYDIRSVLRETENPSAWSSDDKEAERQINEHPDVLALGGPRYSYGRTTLRAGQVGGVDILGGTAKLKHIEWASWSQMDLMYQTFMRATQLWRSDDAAVVWAAIFDLSRAMLKHVVDWRRAYEVYLSDNSWDVRRVRSAKQAAKRLGYAPLGGRGTNWATILTLQKKLKKDLDMWALSFDWEGALTPAAILQACADSSARVCYGGATFKEDCFAISHVVCEENEARALLRHGWPSHQFNVVGPYELHEVEAATSPLEPGRRWFYFWGA